MNSYNIYFNNGMHFRMNAKRFERWIGYATVAMALISRIERI